MASSSESRPGTYLPTGWRIVGAGAERIAERAKSSVPADRLRPGRPEDTLYAVEFTTSPTVRGRPTVERALDAVTAEIRGTWEDCPRLIRDEDVERAPSRFGGLRYRTHADPGREWIGEIVWRAVHPRVPGAPVTTRVLLEERPSFTRLGVRVSADEGLASVRVYVGAGQARPAFLDVLREEVTPSWMGAPLARHPIRPGDERHFMLGVLEEPSRRVPVVVLSPLEEGGYLIDPDDLAWELFGRALLYVIGRHQQTFDLTDAIGDRRMSCYWGAARCYMPGWSRYDDFHEHPLLVGDRLLDPVMRAAWLGEIGVWTGSRAELRPSLDERFPGQEPPEAEDTAEAADAMQAGGPLGAASAGDAGSAAQAPAARGVDAINARAVDAGVANVEAVDAETLDTAAQSPDGRAPEALEEPGPDGEAAGPAPEADRTTLSAAPDPPPVLEELVNEVRSMASLLDRVLSAHAELVDEVERLRTISALRSSSTNAIERRLGRLEDILERMSDGASPVPRAADDEHGPDRPTAGAADDDEGRLTLVEVVQDAVQSHADELVFLDAALDSAANSPYEDPSGCARSSRPWPA